MAKIGRNEPCLCGSGLKYKKCCGEKGREEDAPKSLLAGGKGAEAAPKGKDAEAQIRLEPAIAWIKQEAVARRKLVISLGVLILFSTEEGDSWLLEATDQDALQLTASGQDLSVKVEETPEATIIDWTHKFSLKKGTFQVTAYRDKRQKHFDHYPVQMIHAAMKGIQKRIPAHLAGRIHMAADES